MAYDDPGWECFGKGLYNKGPCPGPACPWGADCILQTEAGTAVIIDWDQAPPQCFGTGALVPGPIWGDIPTARDEPCDQNFCDYFRDCADGSIPILAEEA